ncbi:Dcp1p-Dcp2p decapping enzyme complex alpha subunit [Coemansia erecta]|nr:Dcp1p-Dcp2p decapping enzyme complex alpha subunit [Coemansia erecta]
MAGEIPEIPGRMVPNDQAYELRNKVGTLTQTLKPTFQGSQPVSFTRSQSLTALLERDFFVCEKSDGVRVLVLMIMTLAGPQTFFITRKNEYYHVPHVAFPAPEANNFDKFQDGTLIDAELVFVKMPDGSQKCKLLAFDALVVGGKNYMAEGLERRLGFLYTHVIRPFKKMCAAMPPDRARLQPFFAVVKEFRRSYHVPYIYDVVIPSLHYKCDGLIFTSVDAPYTIGTCDNIIKWKPASENSIDFKVSVRNNVPMLTMWAGGNEYRDFAPMAVRPTNAHRIQSLDGRIVEVRRDPDFAPPAEWRFMRFREDKVHGNHMSVVPRILTSIEDGLELDELRRMMPQIKENWYRRDEERARAKLH